MLDFLLSKPTKNSTQRFINKLNPAVNIHLHDELPLPSIKEIKKLAPTVSTINGFAEQMEALSEEELKAKTPVFQSIYEKAVAAEKEALQKTKDEFNNCTNYEERESLNLQIDEAQEKLKKARKKILDEILPEAFAVVRETGRRVLNMRHFDVQLLGGMVLHNGNIAEMTTGEGKTLVATLPAYLNALTGEGVHVVTVNDYLAKRDRDWMAPIFEFHGLTVGVILHDMEPPARKEAYAADITYGTNNEFGFDYLRDNMVIFKEEMVQRPHYFAVVDEVDSILIDEARTPLIISGPAEESTDKYYKAYQITGQLKGRRITEKEEVEAKYQEVDLSEGYDYLADEKNKSISMTEAGEEKAAKAFGIDNLHDMDTVEYRHHILQALKAREFFKRDVDYVVKDGEVIIVDEFTGRMMPGRRWSDGLHQAVEAREGIKIARENQTLATITFQNYFRLYEKLSGMTGTAYTEASEFKQIYELDVVVTPTNKPLQRKNYADAIYKTQQEKYNAVGEEIVELHKKGAPVLVGTISIEKSELLSHVLTQKGVPHNVLNAKYHSQEANIISQAGRKGAVTIATNMAGRGTDIVLGGNPEFLAKNLVKEKGGEDQSEEEQQSQVKKFLEEFKEQCKKEQGEVLEVGGLHVLGTERHESRRIDNQLRGRQGRQGDPGASKFYVSLEDDLMRLFASDRIIGLMDKLGMEEGQVLEHPWLNKALENAQRRVEGHNFEIRKHLLEFDDVMNRQREVIYNMRRSILESEDIKDQIIEAIDEVLMGAIKQHLTTFELEEETDEKGFIAYLKAAFLYDATSKMKEWRGISHEEIFESARKDILDIYNKKDEEIGAERLRQVERMFMLNTIDAKWKDHLYTMDQLKEGIGLRSYGQRDPIIEYKKEGFALFEGMYNSINQEVAEVILKLQPASQERKPQGVFAATPMNLIHNETTGFSEAASRQQAAQSGGSAPPSASPEAPQPVRNEGPKVGRNDSCPCGSGKKYKKCCG